MVLKRVVLGVGQRARRYDLRFPRVRPVYVDDAVEVQTMASVCRVVGAVLTGPAAVAVQAARVLKALAPRAYVVGVGIGLVEAEEELREEGVAQVAGTWLMVVGSLATAVRFGRAPVPLMELGPVTHRRLH